MSVAKSDFSQMHRSRSDWIMNTDAERFTWIDLDRSRFEQERNQDEWKPAFCD